MATASQLKVTEDQLLRVELPKYLDVDEVAQLERIFNTYLQNLRRRRKDLEQKVSEVERRIGVLKSRVVVLESA